MALVFNRRIAWSYDSWLNSREGMAFTRVVCKALEGIPLRSGDRVLEVGCGMGNHITLLESRGFELYGIDASGYMIDKARERLGNACTFKMGIAEDIPFEDNQFELVMLINTLEFVDDFKKAIAEAGRVSRKWICIGFFNSFSWFCISEKIRGLFQKGLFSEARFFNLWELKGYIKSILGDVEMEWYCNLPWSPWVSRIGKKLNKKREMKPCPFGSFIVLSVSLVYKMRTEGLPLSVKIKDATESIVGGLTMKGGFNHNERRYLN